MKQLLLRVDEELHAALSAEAQAAGRSVNALANEVLATAVASSSTRRERLNRKLSSLGIADVNWGLGSPRHSRAEALAATSGRGPAIDESIDSERAPR